MHNLSAQVWLDSHSDRQPGSLEVTLPPEICGFQNSGTPLIQMLVIKIANYLDQLGLLGKFVDNSTKLTWLRIICYQIKHSKVLWLIKIQPDMVKRIRCRYILWIITAKLQTANVVYFQKKSSYPDFLHIQMAWHPN